MKPRISLRRRVMLAYTALGFLLSLLFAAATVALTENYEHILVNEILQSQAQDYSARIQAGTGVNLPRTHRLSGYLRRPDGSGEVPATLADLAPGVHESDEDEGDAHVGVFDTPSGRMYFVIDLGDIEALERYLMGFLIAVIVIGTTAGGWLGSLLAGMTIAPVRRLAQAVDALPVQPRASGMKELVGDDELGRLAQAIDAYQLRLVDADAHERQFFADASHELRTPIAVVRGAVEVLLDEPSRDDADRRRLQRLERGMTELTDLLEVLLGLARRRQYPEESIDAQALLNESLAALGAWTAGATLTLNIQASGTLHAPMQQASLVVRGILRHLLPPQATGELRLCADARSIAIEHTWPVGEGQDAAVSSHAGGDRGLGLTLVGRLASQLGWCIGDIESQPGRRTVCIALARGEYVS